MNKIVKFGEDVQGFDVPVLNEREIRAAAGILFLILFIAVMNVFLKENTLLLKYAITIFLTDILIRVFVSPRYAPTLIIGRWIVRNQTPEYVGAPQKLFAWKIGAALGSIFFVFFVVTNSYSPITGLICFTCLIFLFFETAFGICLGCKFYPMFHKNNAQYCPGDVCETTSSHDIQKISRVQVLILLLSVGYVVFLALTFNDYFAQKPYDLFGLEQYFQSK